MVPRGLEPRTLRLLAVRSNQLSYGTSCDICKLTLKQSKSSSDDAQTVPFHGLFANSAMSMGRCISRVATRGYIFCSMGGVLFFTWV